MRHGLWQHNGRAPHLRGHSDYGPHVGSVAANISLFRRAGFMHSATKCPLFLPPILISDLPSSNSIDFSSTSSLRRSSTLRSALGYYYFRTGRLFIAWTIWQRLLSKACRGQLLAWLVSGGNTPSDPSSAQCLGWPCLSIGPPSHRN